MSPDSGKGKPAEVRLSIDEVADLTGLRPHVLRYWEGEFPQLKPERTKANQRLYRQKDVDIVLHIKRLVHGQQYTLQGARKQLSEDLKEARQSGQLALELDLGSADLVGALIKARRQARALLEALDRATLGGEA